MTQRRLTDIEKIQVVEKFKTGNYTYTALAKEYNIGISSIYSLLKRRNVEAPKNSHFFNSKKKYTVNKYYFDVIDTEEKAYFLGLMYADGYNNEKKGCFVLALQEEDREILERFNLELDSNRPLFEMDLTTKKPTHKNKTILNISDRYMTEQLAKLGCVQAKSLILKFPTEEQVPNHLLKHFIRGYFDGDGCISYWWSKKGYFKYEVSLTSSEDFCVGVANLLKRELDIDVSFSIRYKERNNSTRSIRVARCLGIQKFMKWIYDDCKIYLKRKMEKYNSLIEIIKQSNGKKLLLS